MAGPGDGVALQCLGDGEQEGEGGRLCEFAQCHSADGGNRHQRPHAEATSKDSSYRLRDECRSPHCKGSQECRCADCVRLQR